MTAKLGPWIALGGLLVGAGLAVGLAIGLRPASTTPPSSPPAQPSGPPIGDAPIAEAARVAFEPTRLTWKRACWDPITARAPAPPASRHPINLAYDAAGNEVLRAVNEMRDRTRGDVALCLRDQPFTPTRIAPPGRAVNVTIEIAFP